MTLSVPGVYGYRCTPHGTLGMVGLIVVGQPTNEEAAKSAAMSGAAGRVFARLFQTLDFNQGSREVRPNAPAAFVAPGVSFKQKMGE